jgi:hypothetical protein
MSPETQRAKEMERHPYVASLQDPIEEDTRRNRRALISVAGVCLFVRLSGALPTEWTAIGVKFSGTAHAWMIRAAVASNVYLLCVFGLSAVADFIRWRKNLGYRVELYVSEHGLGSSEFINDSLNDLSLIRGSRFSGWVGEAILRAQVFLSGKLPQGFDASDKQTKRIFSEWKNQRRGLYSALWRIYPTVPIHHFFLFALPFLLSIAASLALVTWKQ